MADEYKEIALSKEGAEALIKALSEANEMIVNGGKKPAKKPSAKSKATGKGKK